MANSSRMNVRRVLAIVVMVACALGTATVAVAQETTGRLVGTVSMKADQSMLPGVAVEALHVPTGTRYTAVTAANGRYNILNVRVGGPYTITAQISGFRASTQKDISVALGESRQVNFALDLESVTEAIVVTAESAPLITPDKMGSGMAVSESAIKSLPTISRQFQDFARTNPYVNVSLSDDAGSSMAVAGKNNRYNTIQIDGAVNNDLFGLGTYGSPGSQTYTQPISLDAVQELQVVVSPYDIKQGGFTGGAINAITRSGSNTWSASVYGSTRDESFVGDKYGNAYGDTFDRPVASFNVDQLSARLGGPILKDKLFFFLSGEMNRRSEPTGGAADGSGTNNYNNPAEAARFRSILINKYGYDPGTLGDYNGDTDSNLLVGKLDFNFNESNNITLRHNFVDASRDVTPTRISTTYGFETAGYTIASKTNSTVLQANSVFGASSFNVGRVGYQTVRDSREVPVAFPSVYICTSASISASGCTGNGTYKLLAGTERSSGANALDQDILEITDDFTLLKGDHTITLGTHNEFFKFSNVFIQDVTGSYFFRSVDAFEAGTADRYLVKYATGSDPRRPTEFSAQQWGLYAGDQWRVSNSLSLNLGLRLDVPRLTDKPTYNPAVDTAFGINTTEVPSSQVMISPRVGFNWTPTKSGKDQVRGGVGVFAGRTPYVWISNAYGGTGIERIDLSAPNVPFNPDPYNPPINFPPGTGAVSVDTIDPDFKFPLILRSTLAYDRELPGGIRATVEGMFTKTLQDVFYTNINKIDSGAKTFFGAPVYANKNAAFSNVTYLTNTSRGEQQNISATLEKRFPFGLYVSGSYAYTNAKAAFEATSSVAYSNWQFQTHNGDIYTEHLTRSFFEIRDRFVAVASQTFRTGPVSHNIGLVFNAQSGQPYSVLMGGDANKDGASGNDLLYVPANYSDIVWKGTGAPTEAKWNEFLSKTGLEAYRGRVSERNALDAPWTHTLDFHYDFEIPITAVKAQVTFDVLNLINLIDSDSGLMRYVFNQTYNPITYSGQDAATGKPIYTVNSGMLDEGKQYSTNTLRSRWQIKLGARLTY